MEFVAREKAYSKINLHLEVLNKRNDGYHNVFSLNASLDLFDLLKLNKIDIFKDLCQETLIEIIPQGGEFEEIIRSIEIEENLISKSIETYFKRIGKRGRVSISIEKNIPIGAGLGGGSSDAAATFRLLNNYFKRIDNSELLKLGSMVGADVPYCLTGGFAICEGIGNRIEKLEGKLDNYVLFVNTGMYVNTEDAYKGLNRNHKKHYKEVELEEKREKIREGVQRGDINYFKFFLKNDFEEPVFERYPEIRAIKEEIKDFEAEFVTMTGSGSVLIGLFRDFQKARMAEMNLQKRVKQVYITRFI